MKIVIRKIVLCLAIFTLLIGSGMGNLAGIAKANETPAPAVTLSGEENVAPGQSFDLTYGLSNVANVYAQDLTISYDPGQLEFVSAESTKNGLLLVDKIEKPGQVRILAADVKDANANGNLMALHWKAKQLTQSATTNVTVLGVTIADAAGKETQVNGTSHSVRINLIVPNPGDLNGDGKYTVGDLAIVAAYYGKTSADPDWALYKKADINNDGIIDIADLAAVARKILGIETPETPQAALSSLELQATIGGGGQLTPAFSPSVKSYTAKVQSDISNILIKPGAAAGSTMTVNGSKPQASGYNAALQVGSNSFEIKVKNAEGNEQAYTVSIVRDNIQPVADKFLDLTYNDTITGVTMKYRLFVPDNYNPAQSYPLVFFLHGDGERGSDNMKHLTANEGATVWAKPEEQAKHAAFVLAPQCPIQDADGDGVNDEGVWTDPVHGRPYTPTKNLETANRILQKVLAEYKIDANRIYSTGISMGGFGTWANNIYNPDLFAAMVPVAGYGDPVGAANKLAAKPIWQFTAEADPLVSVNSVRATINAVKAAGGNPKYTEYPKSAYFYPIAHFSWVPAYADEAMRDWLFAQKKSK